MQADAHNLLNVDAASSNLLVTCAIEALLHNKYESYRV